MVNLTISEDTYSLIRGQVASILETQMLNGAVTQWDDFNCLVLRALLELNRKTYAD